MSSGLAGSELYFVFWSGGFRSVLCSLVWWVQSCTLSSGLVGLELYFVLWSGGFRAVLCLLVWWVQSHTLSSGLAGSKLFFVFWSGGFRAVLCPLHWWVQSCAWSSDLALGLGRKASQTRVLRVIHVKVPWAVGKRRRIGEVSLTALANLIHNHYNTYTWMGVVISLSA